MMHQDYLFQQLDIHNVIRGQEEKIKKNVQAIPANQLLNASEEDLLQAFVADLQLHVPVVQEDQIYIAESREASVDVSRDPMRMIYDRSKAFYLPGSETVIAIPFEGDPDFFRVRPQTFTINPPMAEVGKDELLLTYMGVDLKPEMIKMQYQRTVAEINSHLRSLAESAQQFNTQLPLTLAAEIKKRKERLLADSGMTAALGLPIRKRHGAPTTYAVPVKKRVPQIEQLYVSMTPFKPEPALAQKDYEDMLRIMESMVTVMELSPHAFNLMGEEDMRTHFLVQLNAQYTGQATGETFNFQGKTDILLRIGGKNVFIAECKFWTGEKALLATLDQLLSYLSWRDTKTAALIFNRNRDFSAVLAKIAESTPKHPLFKRYLGRSGETQFRYVFGQPNDVNREVFLTVLVFDVPIT